MAGPLTEAREHVATALQGLGVRVYALPVEVPAPPCVQVGAASEWIVRQRLGTGKADVALNVRVTVPVVSGNEQALANLEDLVWAIMRIIPVMGPVSAPVKDSANQVDVYMVDLPTMVSTSE